MSSEAKDYARLISAIAGGIMLSRIRSAEPATWMWAFAGAELIRFGITGRAVTRANRSAAIDKVDLGSELSFPASDPPAY